MTDRKNETDDLSGDWASEETLNLQPPRPEHDWLDEFAAEPGEPGLAVEPHSRVTEPLLAVEPLPRMEPAALDELPARVRQEPRRAPPSRRHPLVMLAAGITLVALVESPAVNRPQLLVPWVDVAPAVPAPVRAAFSATKPPFAVPPSAAAPRAGADGSRAAGRAAEPFTLQARREPRPEAPSRLQEAPPARSDTSVKPVVARSTSPAPYSMPPALSARPVTSLDNLLGRPVTSAPLPAPPIVPAAPPPPAESGGGSTAETAARAVRVAAVQSVVDRYRRAFNTLDANAVTAFWPGVDVRGLKRAFDQLELQRFEFERCRVDLAGPRAFASCDGSARSVRKVGDRNPRAQPREWTFTLGQSNDAWVILSVSSRAAQ